VSVQSEPRAPSADALTRHLSLLPPPVEELRVERTDDAPQALVLRLPETPRTPQQRRSWDTGAPTDVLLDAEGFADVLARATPRLVRYARRRLGDLHEAEEVAQEALLRAYAHRHKLATEDDVLAWTTVVTGRLAIDRLRVRGRSVSVADIPEGPSRSRDTADVVAARQDARTALDSLEALPSRQAAVLWAREVEGLRYDEIAERFSLSEPTVRSLLHRGRKALRREYAQRGGSMPLAAALGAAVASPWLLALRHGAKVRAVAVGLTTASALGSVGLAVVDLPSSPAKPAAPLVSAVAAPAAAAAAVPVTAAAPVAAPAVAAPAEPAAPTAPKAPPVGMPAGAVSLQPLGNATCSLTAPLQLSRVTDSLGISACAPAASAVPVPSLADAVGTVAQGVCDLLVQPCTGIPGAPAVPSAAPAVTGAAVPGVVGTVTGVLGGLGGR
jgi:RNA polymerase sigma factor (sigma-70 family)